MYHVGILPASGHAVRWNGVFKELLPIGEDRYLCDYAIDAFTSAGVENIILITSPDKVQNHVRHFRKNKYRGLNFEYVMREGEELHGALQTALKYSQYYKNTYFAMPDTIIPEDAFVQLQLQRDVWFGMGLFETHTPERFSIVEGHTIYTKSTQLLHKEVYRTKGDPYRAWGVIQWSKELVEQLRNAFMIYDTYDKAFQSILEQYKVYHWHLSSYYDIADWKAYQAYIKEHT